MEFDLVKYTKGFFGVNEKEKEEVLKAHAMLTLADMVECAQSNTMGSTLRITFTAEELGLIVEALRFAAK